MDDVSFTVTSQPGDFLNFRGVAARKRAVICHFRLTAALPPINNSLLYFSFQMDFFKDFNNHFLLYQKFNIQASNLLIRRDSYVLIFQDVNVNYLAADKCNSRTVR